MRMDRLKHVRIALGLLCFAPIASANVFDTYGQGAATLAIGNATTAAGRSAYAAYTNPATLTNGTQNEVATHLLMTRFQLRDLPSESNDAWAEDRRQGNRDLQGATLGIHLKLSDALHFGLATYLPQGKVGRIRGLSPQQTTYLRYDGQEQKPVAFTALAWRVSEAFSIGGGAYYSLRARGSLQVNLAQDQSEGRLDLDMEPVIVPYGGILWQHGLLKVGATYREAQESASEIDSSFTFSTTEATLPFEARTSLVPYFDPAQTRLGVAWEDPAYSLYAAVERAAWSRYRAPIVNLSGPDVAAISAEGAGNSRSAGLRDTEAYRLGFAKPLTQSTWGEMDVRFGYEYHTSAHRPGVRSTLVDPTRQVLALGSVWSLPADQQGRRLAFEAAYQFSRLSGFKTYAANGETTSARGGSALHTLSGGLNYAL